MGRTGKKLINYHGSSSASLETNKSSLYQGEIAVVHVGQDDSLLAIKDNDNANLVYFVTSGAVVSMIDAKTTGTTGELAKALSAVSATTIANEKSIEYVSGEVKTLKDVVGNVAEAYIPIADNIARLDASATSVNTRLDNLDAVSAKTITAITVNTVDATVSNGKATVTVGADKVVYSGTTNVKGAIDSLIAKDSALQGEIGALQELHEEGKTVAQEVQAGIEAIDTAYTQTAAANNGGLNLSLTQTDGKIAAFSGSIAPNTYDAYGDAAQALTDAKDYTDTKVGEEKTAREDADNALDIRVAANENKLDGIDTTVVDYVDTRLTSVYVFMGSKTPTEINAMTTSGQKAGYVYNMTSAGTINNGINGGALPVQKGDNVAAVIENGTLKWDKLASDIDLTGYATREELTTVSGNLTTMISEVSAATNSLESAMDARVDKLEATHATDGTAFKTVAQEVQAGIEAIDTAYTQSAAAANGGLNLSLTQTDGKIVAFSGSIEAETYDVYGAAASAKTEVIGKSTDAGSANTIYGAKKYAEDLNATMDTRVDALEATHAKNGDALKTVAAEIDEKINALDKDSSQTAAASNGWLNLSVSEANGLVTAITGSITANKYETSGAANTVKSEVIGTTADTASANTIYGAKKHADGLNSAMDARVGALEAISGQSHTHSNKTVLDGITTEKVSGWDNAAASAHNHTNKTVLDGITSEKVSGWDAAEQNAKDYADGLNSAMDARVDALEAAKITKAQVTDTTTETAINVVASLKDDNHTVDYDFTNMVIDCGTF